MSEGYDPKHSDEPQFIPSPSPAQDATVKPMGNYAPEVKPSAVLAIIALVVSILAFLTGLIPFWGVGLAIVGLVLAIIALVKVNRGTASGKGMAITSIILSALALVAGAIMTTLTVIGLVTLNQCKETGTRHPDGTITCEVNGVNFELNEKPGSFSFRAR